MREAAEEKLNASRPGRLTPAELREFAAACDALHPPGTREPGWAEVKRGLVETRYPERIANIPVSKHATWSTLPAASDASHVA